MRKKHIPVLFVSIFMATAVQAAEHRMRPGLWEMSTTSDLLRLVPHIPADQMERLRNLARQNGIDMPEIRNGAATSKVCITPEMASRDIPPDLTQRESGCAAKNISRTGSTYKTDLVCDGPKVKGTGKAEGSFSSPESFTGRTEFVGEVQGTPVNERADTSGRWVGADCGTVRPPQ
jgi:hypothetical protein